jgi:hypothetical protein
MIALQSSAAIFKRSSVVKSYVEKGSVAVASSVASVKKDTQSAENIRYAALPWL